MVKSLLNFSLLLSLSFIVSCDNPLETNSDNSEIVNSKPGRGDALIVGDGLAYGEGATGSAFTPANCIANRFGVRTLNKAVPGQTTMEHIQNISAYLTPRPKMVFLSLGVGDVLQNQNLPGSYPEEMSVQQLGYVIDRYQKAGLLVVYLGLNPLGDPVAARRFQRMANEASRWGAVVVDGMAGLWGTAHMHDEYHPNIHGYRLMCERIFAATSPHFP